MWVEPAPNVGRAWFLLDNENGVKVSQSIASIDCILLHNEKFQVQKVNWPLQSTRKCDTKTRKQLNVESVT